MKGVECRAGRLHEAHGTIEDAVLVRLNRIGTCRESDWADFHGVAWRRHQTSMARHKERNH